MLELRGQSDQEYRLGIEEPDTAQKYIFRVAQAQKYITSRVFVSSDSEKRANARLERGCEGPTGNSFPFPRCGDVAEIKRKQRGLVHPARNVRKAGIGVQRLQSRLAR